jgi:hypothetical protein
MINTLLSLFIVASALPTLNIFTSAAAVGGGVLAYEVRISFFDNIFVNMALLYIGHTRKARRYVLGQ